MYVDDILIFSSTPDQHAKDLSRVLHALGRANFRVSLKKSILGVERVHYLGHILTPGAIQQDPAKIEAMKQYPEPTTIKGVRRFIGMTGFYRRFIRNYSKSLTSLGIDIRKGSYHPNEDQKQSFTSLKQAMVTAPVLQLYQARQETRLEVDSCSTGWCCHGTEG